MVPPTDRSTKCLMRCKVHLVLQQMAETVSKSIRNWQRYPFWNCCKIDKNMRFWRIVSQCNSDWLVLWKAGAAMSIPPLSQSTAKGWNAKYGFSLVRSVGFVDGDDLTGALHVL